MYPNWNILIVYEYKYSFRALWVSCVGLILVFSINFYTGMIMYAAYHDCDPLRSNVSTTMTMNCIVFWDTIPRRIVTLLLYMPLIYIGELEE